MSEQERKEKAMKLYEQLQNLMLTLHARWQDESKYENIDDYGESIEKHVAKIGGEFVKMNKRPFGFIYKLADATYQVMVRVGSYEYKRIA